jgi:hypothetical protein
MLVSSAGYQHLVVVTPQEHFSIISVMFALPPLCALYIAQHPFIERQVQQLRVPRSPGLIRQMLLHPQLPVDCRMVIHLRAHHKSKTLFSLVRRGGSLTVQTHGYSLQAAETSAGIQQ